MTDKFICRQCTNDGPHIICYTENASTAFPYYKLKNLGCIRKNRTPNWEFVEEVLHIHIPRNFTPSLTQEDIRKEEEDETIL
jgi:hypothetical protein